MTPRSSYNQDRRISLDNPTREMHTDRTCVQSLGRTDGSLERLDITHFFKD